jgi:hypothetical protein
MAPKLRIIDDQTQHPLLELIPAKKHTLRNVANRHAVCFKSLHMEASIALRGVFWPKFILYRFKKLFPHRLTGDDMFRGSASTNIDKITV